MFSRLHVEEIRRRRAKQNRELLINRGNGAGTFRNNMVSSERQLLNMSYNVARHVGKFGQSSPVMDHRLSLPVRPTGCKESRFAHRTKLTLPKHDDIKRGNLPDQKKENSFGQEKTTNERLQPDGKATKEPIRIEECHHLCLPQHIVDRLRPIWAQFEQPPPAEDDFSLSYRFADVRSRLRKAKQEMNVDLDEMFGKLGISVSEMKSQLNEILTVDEKVPKHEAESETPKREIQPSESECPSPLPPADVSPANKRVCRVLDYLNEFDKDGKKNRLDVSAEQADTVIRSRSLSDLTERLQMSGGENRNNPVGMDILALKLCSMRPNSERRVYGLNFAKFTKGQTSKPVAQRKETMPIPKLTTLLGQRRDKEMRQPCGLLQRNNHLMKEKLNERRHASFDEHASVEQPKKQRRFRPTLRGEQLAQPIASHSFWVSPEAAVIRHPRVICGETEHTSNGEQFCFNPPPEYAAAPSHPLWDTPEELRTSTTFANFYV